MTLFIALSSIQGQPFHSVWAQFHTFSSFRDLIFPRQTSQLLNSLLCIIPIAVLFQPILSARFHSRVMTTHRDQNCLRPVLFDAPAQQSNGQITAQESAHHPWRHFTLGRQGKQAVGQSAHWRQLEAERSVTTRSALNNQLFVSLFLSLLSESLIWHNVIMCWTIKER